MTFKELQLAVPILRALTRCGHNLPTPVQAEAIPRVLAGHDLIASAQTGTGKTAAFVLPALQRLITSFPARKSGLKVLVITPTRELASQIVEAARSYARYLDVHSVAIFGGMPFGDQIRALAQLPDMIVATPGRLIDHIWRGRIDLSHVEMLVLDEADRMLDMGFIDDVEFISDAVPEGCQTLLFAATMGDATTGLAKKFMKNPERIEIEPGTITHDRIEQRLHLADNLQHKNRLLQHVCSDKGVTRAIIFSATKRDADSLARELHRQGHAAAALHGDMTQAARNRTIMNMRRGRVRLLVATDVAARGLDITGVSHVINFDLPRSAEDYVNRIGRTGRAGESGVAISFASRGDFSYLDRIEDYLGQNLSVHVIPGLEPAYPARGRKSTGNAGRRSARGNGSRSGSRTFDGRPSRYKGRQNNGASSKSAGSRAIKQESGLPAELARGNPALPAELARGNPAQPGRYGNKRSKKKSSMPGTDII